MNSNPYPNKTDRDVQWEKISNSWDASRSVIKFWHKYFFEGLFEGKTDLDTSLLLCNPVQSLEAWQTSLDQYYEINPERWEKEKLTEEVLGMAFYSLQKSFLGWMNGYFFHPEDRAWIFTQIFGETYDLDRKFPLLLPNESEYRSFSYSIVEIISSIFVEINSCLRGKKDSYYVLYIENYIASCIPYIPVESFSVSMPEEGEQRSINRSLNRIIHFAHQDIATANDKDKPKIELACKVKAIFDNYEGDLGEYKQLVELVEREGPQV